MQQALQEVTISQLQVTSLEIGSSAIFKFKTWKVFTNFDWAEEKDCRGSLFSFSQFFLSYFVQYFLFMEVVTMVPSATIFMLPAFSQPEKYVSSQNKSKLNETSLVQEEKSFLNYMLKLYYHVKKTPYFS